MPFYGYNSLQKQGTAIIEAIQIIEDVSIKFNNLKGQIEIKINEKLQTVLTKNKGFQIVCNISKILSGEEENVGCLDIPEDLTSSDMAYFKYAPTTGMVNLFVPACQIKILVGFCFPFVSISLITLF